MNVLTLPLYRHGYPSDTSLQASYGPSYGNRVANERLLRERWEREHAATAPAANEPIDASDAAAGREDD